MAGLFLSFEGLDGAGKSTQVRLLADWLKGQGHDVVTCRDPGGTVLARFTLCCPVVNLLIAPECGTFSQ